MFWEQHTTVPRRNRLREAKEAYLIEIENDLPNNFKDFVIFYKDKYGLVHYLKPINEPLFKYMIISRKKPKYRFRINTDEVQIEDIVMHIREYRKKLRIFVFDIKYMRAGYI